MLGAIDIGGTKIRVCVAKSPTNIIDEVVFPTPPSQFLALNAMLNALNDLKGKARIQSLGIASPGPIDKNKGIILQPRNIPWHNLKINDYFKNKLGCLVALDNDATLAGMAEANFGNGKNSKVLLYLSISTGVNSAIIIDDQPIPSAHNCESGYQIVQFRPFPPTAYQKIASGKAIQLKYGKIAADIVNKKAWAEIAKNISVGLFNLITVIQPHMVVLGGGVSIHYHHFREPLRDYLNKYHSLYPLPPIKQAKFVETAPLIGALIKAKDEISPIK